MQGVVEKGSAVMVVSLLAPPVVVLAWLLAVVREARSGWVQRALYWVTRMAVPVQLLARMAVQVVSVWVAGQRSLSEEQQGVSRAWSIQPKCIVNMPA